jgi:hypothetical protein
MLCGYTAQSGGVVRFVVLAVARFFAAIGAVVGETAGSAGEIEFGAWRPRL